MVGKQAVDAVDTDSTAGDIVHDSRYNYLRNHLSRLGYNAHLPHDGVELCEGVFLDLVDLTRRFRDMKLSDEKSRYEVQQMEGRVNNLRRENSSLLDKLNTLYQDKIKKDEKQSNWALEDKGESEELKHKINQLNARLKKSEDESERLRKQLNKVYKNKGVFVAEAQPMDRTNLVAKGQSIDQTGSMGPAILFPSLPLHTNISATEVGDLKDQLDKFSRLHEEHLAEEEGRLKELQLLKSALKERECEIERLNKLCVSDESFEKLNRQLADKSNQETNEFLNKKVDFLNLELGKAEKELKKLEQKDRIIERLTAERQELEGKFSIALSECNQIKNEVNDLREREQTWQNNQAISEDQKVKQVTKATKTEKTKEKMSLKIKELEREVFSLKEQNEELSEVYQDYQRDRKNLMEVLWQRDKHNSNTKEEIENLKAELEKAYVELARSESLQKSALHKTKACEEDIGLHQKTVNELTSKCREAEGKMRRLECEFMDSKAAAKKYLENNIALQNKILVIKEDNETLNEELRILQTKELDSTRAKGLLEKKKDALLQRITDSEKHLDTLRDALSKKCGELECQNRQTYHIQEELTNIKEELQETNQQNSKLEFENQDLKTERAILKDRFDERSKELDRRKTEINRLEKKLSNCNDHVARIEQLEQELHILSTKDCQSSSDLLALRNDLIRKEEESKAREAFVMKLKDDEIELARLVKEKNREIHDLVENLRLRDSECTSLQKQTKALQHEVQENERKFLDGNNRMAKMIRDNKKRDLDMNELVQKLKLMEKKFEDQKGIAVNCEYSLKKMEQDLKHKHEAGEKAHTRILNMEKDMERNQDELARAMDEKRTAEFRISELISNLEKVENELMKKDELVQDQQNMIEKIDTGIGISNEEIVRCRTKITELKTLVEEKQDLIAVMKIECNDLNQQLTSKTSTVTDLKQSITEKDIRVKHFETQCTELSEQLADLRKVQNDTEEELGLWKEGHKKEAEYNILWQETYEKLKSQYTEVSVENVELTNQIDTLQFHYNQLQTELRELQENYEKLQVVNHEETANSSILRKKNEQLSSELLVLTQTRNIACDKEKSLENIVEQQRIELGVLKSKSGSESSQLQTLRGEMENFERVVCHKDCRITKLEEELKNLMTDNQKLSRKLTQETRYVLDLKTMLSMEKDKVSKLKTDNDAFRLKSSEQSQERSDTKRHLQSLLNQIEQHNDQLARKEAAMVNLTRKLEKEQMKCQECNDQVTRALLDKSTLKNKVELLTQDLNVEKVKFEDLQNSHKRLKQQLEIIQRYRPMK